MKIEELNERNILFLFGAEDCAFDTSTAVFAVAAKTAIFVCDTHVGPRSMVPVKAHLESRFPGRATVVFNSHMDWDHVWGNCAFAGAAIYAHTWCREALANDDIWAHMLEAFGEYRNGPVDRTLPNVTFSDSVVFHGDGVELFHSPGHTRDSASCLDTETGVLFVADNVELPLPSLQHHDLGVYLDTLDRYREIAPTLLVTGHNGVVEKRHLSANRGYVEEVLAGRPIDAASEDIAGRDLANRKQVLVSRYEEAARQTLGQGFSWKRFLDTVGGSFTASPEELEQVLARFVESGNPGTV